MKPFLNLIFVAILGALSAAAADAPSALDEAKPPSGAVRPEAVLFDLGSVRLLDGPFKTALDLNGQYLLSLDADHLLSWFRKNAGLQPKAPVYGGWESLGVAGHSLGHYLSALAQCYAATGDRRFLDRLNYIVDELAECQAKDPTGYLAAIPNGKAIFEGLKQRGGQMEGWVPWYTVHKLMAGLRDAWLLGHNEKAEQVLIGLARWTDSVTKNLSESEKEVMLSMEHGGMPEVLADVSAITGDPAYLAVARRFCHRSVMDPLARGEDRLSGLHANTQIPKMTGAARLYELTGDDYFRRVALNFWNCVVTNRTFAIGGNSDDEHFFPPEQTFRHLSTATAETCNTYNMLKLTEHLFGWEPSARWMDYYERALYNQILASQDPDTGMFTYFVPLKPGQFKLYSTPTNAFWCCVGTGMENHTKYAKAIYAHSDDALWVNLFIPSELSWRAKDLLLIQETRFPEDDTVRLSFKCNQPLRLALNIRAPSWLAGGLVVRVNGAKQTPTVSNGYATITRAWRDGDRVEVRLPMALHTEPLPYASNIVAILDGPIVLAAALGRSGLDSVKAYSDNQIESWYRNLPVPEQPVIICEKGNLLRHISPVSGPPLTFKTRGLVQPNDVTLIPFYRMHHQRYAVYFPAFSPAGWREHQAELRVAEQQRKALDARTVDQVQPGEQQPEVDHAFQGEKTEHGQHRDRSWRDARDGGWFEYRLKVLPDQPLELLCSYWGEDSGARLFDILVDGKVVGTQKLDRNHPDDFFDVTYPLPTELTRGKQQVTVRFQAHPGNFAGGVFGLRVVKPSPHS
jgi:DUF1680 family protein